MRWCPNQKIGVLSIRTHLQCNRWGNSAILSMKIGRSRNEPFPFSTLEWRGRDARRWSSNNSVTDSVSSGQTTRLFQSMKLDHIPFFSWQYLHNRIRDPPPVSKKKFAKKNQIQRILENIEWKQGLKRFRNVSSKIRIQTNYFTTELN